MFQPVIAMGLVPAVVYAIKLVDNAAANLAIIRETENVNLVPAITTILLDTTIVLSVKVNWILKFLASIKVLPK